MTDFKSFLSETIDISESDWEMILPKINKQQFSKGEILTPEGIVENNLYFLLDGACRMYCEMENKDVTLNIGFPGSFISSYTSFLRR